MRKATCRKHSYIFRGMTGARIIYFDVSLNVFVFKASCHFCHSFPCLVSYFIISFIKHFFSVYMLLIQELITVRAANALQHILIYTHVKKKRKKEHFQFPDHINYEKKNCYWYVRIGFYVFSIVLLLIFVIGLSVSILFKEPQLYQLLMLRVSLFQAKI